MEKLTEDEINRTSDYGIQHTLNILTSEFMGVTETVLKWIAISGLVITLLLGTADYLSNEKIDALEQRIELLEKAK